MCRRLLFFLASARRDTGLLAWRLDAELSTEHLFVTRLTEIVTQVSTDCVKTL
jgi:hypothetical protein